MESLTTTNSFKRKDCSDDSGTSLNDVGGPINKRIRDAEEPTSVIRVVIENMLIPVSLEALHEVFSNAGKVDKIVTFSKNGKFQSLVQFNSPRFAQIAKTTLDNQNIYPNTCTMRIDYSKLECLNVRFNNDKSRDFTNSTLPQGSSSSMNVMGGGLHNSVGVQKNHNDLQLDPLIGANPIDPSSLAPMLKLASTNPSFNALAAAVLASLQRSNNQSTEPPPAYGHGLSQAHNQYAMVFNSFQQQALQQQQQQRMIPCGPVLLASNLDEQV